MDLLADVVTMVPIILINMMHNLFEQLYRVTNSLDLQLGLMKLLTHKRTCIFEHPYNKEKLIMSAVR